MINRPQDARHICRWHSGTGVPCGFVVDPSPGAHGILRAHNRKAHGLTSTPVVCHTECGYRAKPSEGRYTQAECITCGGDGAPRGCTRCGKVLA